MISKSALASIGVLLAACGLAQDAEFRKAHELDQSRAREALSECERRFPDGEKKPVSGRVKCVTDAHIFQARISEKYERVPVVDLANLYQAKALLAAEKFDRGAISVSQYRLEMAQLHSQFVSQLAARQTSARSAAAAEQQAAAVEQQAAAAAQQSSLATQKAISDAFKGR